MDELDQLFEQAHAGGGRPGVAPAAQGDELDAIFNQAHGLGERGSAFIDAVKQVPAGIAEGTIDTVALLSDLVPRFQWSDPREVMGVDIPSVPYIGPDLEFSESRKADQFVEEYLPAKPQSGVSRYIRAASEFAGPQVIGGGLGLGLKAAGRLGPYTQRLLAAAKPAAVGSAVTAGVGATAAEDLTGDQNVAPLIGAFAGGAAPTAVKNGVKAVRHALKGATDAEVTSTAANAFRDFTGLDDAAMSEALAKRPGDQLGQYMTTAELTENAGAAQIEKNLATTGQRAEQYKKLAKDRELLRNDMLEGLSTAPSMENYSVGDTVINKAKRVKSAMQERAHEMWKQVPRWIDVDVSTQQMELASVLEQRQAGLPLSSKVKKLVKDFLPVADDAEGAVDELLYIGNSSDAQFVPTLTSGAMQDIRSDALTLLREKNLQPHERQVLATLAAGIDDAMENGLQGENYAKWSSARNATKRERQIFGGRTVGKTLTVDNISPENVISRAFKGDKQSFAELKAALQLSRDPKTAEVVKRGIINSIGRDVQDNLTAAKIRKFISGNEEALKDLFSPQHYSQLKRVAEDLQSEAAVAGNAFKASVGNSVTAQRLNAGQVLRDRALSDSAIGKGWLGALGPITQSKRVADLEKVNALLFKAALEPDLAAELVKAPTAQRMLFLEDRLNQLVKDGSFAGIKGVTLELSTDDRQRAYYDKAARDGRDFPAGRQSTVVGAAAQPREYGSDRLSIQSDGQSDVEGSGSLQTGGKRKIQELQQENSSSDASYGRPNSNKFAAVKPVSRGRFSGVAARVLDELNPGIKSAEATTMKQEDLHYFPKDEFYEQDVRNSIDRDGGASLSPSKRAPLLAAVAQVESAFNPKATSRVGAQGVMQVMPANLKKLGVPQSEWQNPSANIGAGWAILSEEMQRFKNLELALAAYNAGSPRVSKAIAEARQAGGKTDFYSIKQSLPEETRDYVRKVMLALDEINSGNKVIPKSFIRDLDTAFL